MEAPLICQIKAGLLSGYIWTLNKTKFITLVVLEYKRGQQACFDVILCSWFSWNGARWTTDHQGSPSAGKGSFARFATGDPTDDGQIVLSGFQQTCLLKSYRFMSEVARFHWNVLHCLQRLLVCWAIWLTLMQQVSIIRSCTIVYYSLFMDIWQSRHILDIPGYSATSTIMMCLSVLRCIAMFCCFTPLQNHTSKIPVPLSEASRCNLQPWVLRRKANDISMPGGVLVQAEWGGAA